MNIKKKVLISFPTSPARPYLHKGVVFASWKLLQDTRHITKLIIPSHNPFENNLHHIVKQFLEEDHDFWLSIDADNPPLKNPLDLIELNRDIIGLPTPVIHFDRNKLGERPVYFNAYKYIKEKDAYTEWPDRKGLQKVDAIGTGCFLIARRVFLHSDMQKGPFTRVLNEDGTVERGNDIAFSERTKKAGFEIYAHFDYPCQHFNEVEVNEMIEQWMAFKK
jgi:hypothetical protein